jgi:hypothetical protein
MEGLVPVGGEEVGKGHWRVNIVQILCTYVCKMIPVETIPGMEGGGDKGE